MTIINLDYAEKFIIVAICCLFLAKIVSSILPKYREYQISRHSDRCKKLLQKLYSNVDAFEMSLDYRKQKNIENSQFTYGEIIYSSFIEMLACV